MNAALIYRWEHGHHQIVASFGYVLIDSRGECPRAWFDTEERAYGFLNTLPHEARQHYRVDPV